MSISTDFIQFLEAIEGFPATHYQHASQASPSRFAWFIFSGSQLSSESLNIGEPPDQVFADLEIYDSDLSDLEETIDALLAFADYRGEFGEAAIEDINFEDQRDDYEPLVDADSVPPFSVFFRVTLTGYR